MISQTGICQDLIILSHNTLMALQLQMEVSCGVSLLGGDAVSKKAVLVAALTVVYDRSDRRP